MVKNYESECECLILFVSELMCFWGLKVWYVFKVGVYVEFR